MPPRFYSSATAAVINVGQSLRESAGTGTWNIASTIVSVLGDTFTTPALNTVRREMDAWSNNANPNVILSPAQVLGLYYADKINSSEAGMMLSWHGIPFKDPARYPGWRRQHQVWIDAIGQSWPRLDTGTLMDLWHQGIVDSKYVQDAIHNSGLFELDRQAVARNTPAVPLADAVNFWQQGFLDQAGYVQSIRRAGLSDQAIIDLYTQQRKPVALADAVNNYWLFPGQREWSEGQIRLNGYGRPQELLQVVELQNPFDPLTALQMNWRGKLNDVELAQHLQANGYVDLDWRTKWIDAQRWIPGPADLISLAVREAWDDATAARFGYDQEFPEPLRYWMARQGADWTEPTPLVAGGPPVQVTWPKAYWRAHWQLMSPTQGYAALQRLRPDRIARYARDIPGLKPFNADDLQTLLKISDYPPEMRRWLQATSYNVLRLSDIRNGYLRAGRTKAWAISQLQDRGYVLDDAADVVSTWDALEQWRRRSGLRRIEEATGHALIVEILAGYGDGMMHRDDARQRLINVGLLPQVIKDQLDLIDSRLLRQSIKAVVAGVRREYLSGSLSEGEVSNYLLASRVQPLRVQQLLTLWSAQKTTQRRALTTAQLLALLRQGVLDSPTVLRRLANLGWVHGDALVLLAGVQRTLSIQAQRLATAQGKARAQQAKAVVAATKQARQLARQGQAELRRLYPKADLKRWLKEGIASVPYVTLRLRQQGYPADYIEGFLRDAGYTKPKQQAAPKAGAPPSGPATGTAPGAAGP